MDTFELEYYKGRWLVPLEVIDGLYDALLRLPADNPKTDYITLASRDSDLEICCATNPKKFVREPFAYTEAEPCTRLAAEPEKSKSLSDLCGRCDDPKPQPPTHDPAGEKAALNPVQDSSEPGFATSESEAVRRLRDRGYVVAPPRVSVGDPGSITPPPPYALHLSSSQPVQSVARHTDAPPNATEKRKRDRYHDGDGVAAPATSRPSTPTRGLDGDSATPQNDPKTNVEPESGDSDADEVVSAPQRKKRKTASRTASTRPDLPQKPASPPRCMKTKRKTLTSTISYKAAADLIGAALKTVDTAITDAENDADVSDGDVGGGLPADRSLEGTAPNCPPTSSPEEIGALNLLSLSISAPNTPPPALPVDEDEEEDSLFVPQEPSTATRNPSSEDATGPSQDRGNGEPPAEERRLHRHFCEDVSAVEGRWDHSSTVKGMAALRQKDPQLRATFEKCLAIARRTMGEGVVHQWRDFQQEGWEKRRQCHSGTTQPAGTATLPDDCAPAVDPARGHVVAEAYRQFRETVKAKTGSWKSCFRYRRATVGLDAQYEAYAKLRSKQSAYRPGALQCDRSMLLRALFREMHPGWRNDLPDNFTDKQAKSRGYGREWKAFNRALQDGRRWKVFVDDLGFGTLLLIDTSGSVDYLQQQIPIPIFAAWTRLISRVRLDVKEVAARVEGYYDGMEDPSFLNRKLRPLKLERRAYRACSPGEQFEFSGSEGVRTPTADPNNLTWPSLASHGMVGEDYAIEDFISSSGLEDTDMSDLLGSNVRV